MKTLCLTLLVLLAWGCNSTTVSSQEESLAALEVHSTSMEDEPAAGLEIVLLGEDEGLVALGKRVAKAAEDNSKVIILYFTASWCPPCRFFDRSLQDPILQSIMQKAVLFKIDVDHTPTEIADHYEVMGYPTYVKVNKEMEELGMIDGGDWGEDIIENLRPVMDDFVNSTKYDYEMEK
jgi:thioredoxin 1